MGIRVKLYRNFNTVLFRYVILPKTFVTAEKDWKKVLQRLVEHVSASLIEVFYSALARIHVSKSKNS